MKAVVDDDRCCGHGVCVALCPDVFDLTDDGYAVAVGTDVPPGLETTVREAATQCPEAAITIHQEHSSDLVAGPTESEA